MDEPDTEPRRVLVVEDRAHRPIGHFPTLFAELAEGFAENGCAVEVLTSTGWLYDGERAVPFVVNRYLTFDRLRYRIGESFANTRGLRRIASRLRTRALVRSARSRCRAAGDPTPDVVVVSSGIDPIVAAAFARPGRWLFYEFGAPVSMEPRFSAGAGVQIATPDEDDTARWREIAPFLHPITLPIAGARARDRVPDAKRRIGLSAEARVALVFGDASDDKDVDLVARVFAELAGWQLVVAGRVAGEYRHAGGREAFIIGGYVDIAMRDVVYSTADLVVLNFKPEYHGNSALVTDAISFGVPIVCSDGSIAAAIVREYRLGVVFNPGDPDSLHQAVDTAPVFIEAADLERARTELSNRAVAARFLRALQYTPPAEGGQP
ncbi:MAG: glycosyltransferase [Acidimicrobiia bacterium]